MISKKQEKYIVENIDEYDHKIFGFLLRKVNRDRVFSVNELAKKIGFSWGATKRHLENLKKLNIVRMERKGFCLKYKLE